MESEERGFWLHLRNVFYPHPRQRLRYLYRMGIVRVLESIDSQYSTTTSLDGSRLETELSLRKISVRARAFVVFIDGYVEVVRCDFAHTN